MEVATVSVSSSQYPASNPIPSAVFTEIVCGKLPVSLDRKHMIVAVDISASMYRSMSSVTKSLLSLSDGLIALTRNTPVVTLEAEVRDVEMSNIPLTVITFDTTAEILWSSGSKSYTEAVTNLKAGDLTNTYDAVKLAFTLGSSQDARWIVILTDGIPTAGEVTDTSELCRLVQTQKRNTDQVITLGYGQNFNADFLNDMGRFTYVNMQEDIAPVFGSIAAEFLTSWGLNAHLVVPGNNGDNVIGTQNIGCLYNEFTYTHAYTPDGEVPDVTLEYIDISTGATITVNSGVTVNTSELPSRLKDKYYQCAKGKVMMNVYSHTTQKGVDPECMAFVVQQVESWTHPEADQYKSSLMNTLNEIQKKGRVFYCRNTLLSGVCDSIRQSSYTDSELKTPTQMSLSIE